MINYGAAVLLIREAACSQRSHSTLKGGFNEELPLDQSCGRVLAEDMTSSELSPPFSNSAMDGFAVVSEQTRFAPVRMNVLGSIAAGDIPPVGKFEEGAWEIMTGAPFPDGFDASVKIEDVQVIRNSKGNAVAVEISHPIEKGQFVRPAGEDFQPGSLIAKKGTWILPEHILAFATLGVSSIPVVRKPRVLVVSTGKELAPVHEKKLPGQIRNSTAPYMKMALPRMGAEVSIESFPSDDLRQFHSWMRNQITAGYDLIITTGGVSMGKFDYVPSVVADLGAEVKFHQIAVRPGKPNFFATFKDGPVVFGLPGNPVSTVVGLRFLVEPYLREWSGRVQEKPWRGQIQETTYKPKALKCFFKARLELNEGIPRVEILSGQESFRVGPVLEANGWAILPEGESELPAGSWVDFYSKESMPDDWQIQWNTQMNETQGGCCG